MAPGSNSVSIPEHVLLEISEYFEPGAFQQGTNYARQGRVTLVHPGWPAVAQVQGSEGYVATVYYTNQTQPSRDMYGECSCPVGLDCKHVVATALIALSQDEEYYETTRDTYKQQIVGEWLANMSVAIDDRPSQTQARKAVVYVIVHERAPQLLVQQSTMLKRGGYGRGSIIAAVTDPRRGVPSWVPDDDVRLITLLRALSRVDNHDAHIEFHRLSAQVIQELATTERLFWNSPNTPPLRWGPTTQGELRWGEIDGSPGDFAIEFDGELLMVPAAVTHYIDPVRSLIGPLDVGVPALIVQELMQAPPVPKEMLATVQRSLRPLLHTDSTTQLAGTGTGAGDEPQDETQRVRPYLLVGADPKQRVRPFVQLNAEAVYGDERFELTQWQPDTDTARDMIEEGRLLKRLNTLLEDFRFDYSIAGSQAALIEARFIAHQVIPVLQDEGWTCEFEDNFPIDPVAVPSVWIEELQPQSDNNDWFSLELGVVIDGRTVPLLPILLTAIRSDALPINSQAFQTRALQGMNLELPEGQLVFISGERLQRWLRPLMELQLRGLDKQEKLVVPSFVAVTLAAPGLGRFSVGPALDAARASVAGLIDLEPKLESADFGTELRPYQRQGVAWLSFLHEAGYGGLLADDMGLGKTVQVLAFLQWLLEADLSSEQPALVIAPLSVVGHWRAEALRFAPALRPLVHLGPTRSRDPAELTTAPLVITTYQTMLRDQKVLGKVTWCTVLFDEAQALKNPSAKVRQAAASLQSRSRFCITGTPIENHLTELWSQIDLVMPGLLGTKQTFGAVFRRPIEKFGITAVLDLLRQRIRPFMLRRTKDKVEVDLPDKIEIIEKINLGAEQRDLYESLRLSLDDQVRKALASKNMSGSSLMVLDALLKLRQVCCHPQLVKLPQAQKIKASAKLDRLMSMLEELADNGRHVLVFSQFTSMLKLIEAECRAAKIGYVKLTGATRKRDEVVAKFQAGGTPIFLISLKAGGTGLNLTRADTVIHYDPWWNPAPEDQATDRAHRIGQDKNVFVYKLVTAGTLEERIIEMQDEKRALTNAALRDGGATNLSVTDLDALYRRLV